MEKVMKTNYRGRKVVEIKDFVGKTFSSVLLGHDGKNILFIVDDKEIYRMFHQQDCCESVYIEDICGDLEDLVGTPILSASEDTNKDNSNKDNDYGSHTWTFYNIRTIKGSVTLRWYGTSNGYYSEAVDIERINDVNEISWFKMK
jgi:hypothetical protein